MRTPISEYKLKRKTKDFLKRAFELRIYSIDNIYAPSDVFDDLLESIIPSERINFIDSIPYYGKKIVRLIEK